LPNYVGQIDEFQISRVARPVGALALAVADQGPNPKLLTLNTAEEGSFFGSGYIGIIMRSVTPDAWVVIGLLGVMAVVSWIVMVGKVMYLNRVTGANRVFLDAFEGALADAADDNRAAFHSVSAMKQPILQRSSLYRVYEVGSRELAMRLDSRKHRISGMLTPQAVAAIRSALDGALVRETQRLGRLMVLLTIAISGGPFLGLLGTVVGVMITFASIAQAGDVNVNAIAPGISAALLATVAGLAVAIPALFAYNYFNSRIRDAIAEMQIFVDELATRMAEGFDAPFDGIPETRASAVVERVR
jgi:biopolymer transport protein ExbB